LTLRIQSEELSVRHDHIIAFNEQMEAARRQTDDTLSVLRNQHQQLETMVSAANDVMKVIDDQIAQLDRLRHVVGQMGAGDGPPPNGDVQNRLAVALRAVDGPDKS
jgi:hypothetical protein